MPRKPKKIEPKTVEIRTSSSPEIIARDTLMFKQHVSGKSLENLAIDFNMTYDNVRRIAKKYNWKSLKKDLARRALAAAMDDVRDIAVMATTLLKHDLRKLGETALKENRQLNEHERTHIRQMLDRVWKEVRLEDGKPTENTGVLSVELRLPPGVKHFGVLPPDPRVKYIEAEIVDERPSIDLEEIEEENKGTFK